MSWNSNLLVEARVLLAQSWERRGVVNPGEYPSSIAISELIDAMMELDDQPLSTLRETVRRKLDQHRFTHESSSTAFKDGPSVEEEVDVVLEALRELRRRNCERGAMSTAAPAPIMFG